MTIDSFFSYDIDTSGLALAGEMLPKPTDVGDGAKCSELTDEPE